MNGQDLHPNNESKLKHIDDSQQQKKSRSRNGCKICKKLKVKCDETKPSCGNCLKLGKKCDYSIKLTWGGRPYKQPKIEKLNPIANLSRLQLQGVNNLKISNDLQLNNINNSVINNNSNKKKVFIFENESPLVTSTIPIKKKNKHDSNHETKVKQINDPFSNLNSHLNSHLNSNSNSNLNPITNIKPTTLSPSDNLSYLIKMSKGNNKLKAKIKSGNCKSPTPDFHSLDESYIPNHTTANALNTGNSNNNEIIINDNEDNENKNTSNFPNKFVNDNVINSIQNVNTVLDSLFGDNFSTTISPWNFLEEIDKSYPTNDNHITSADNIDNDFNFNENLLVPNLNENSDKNYQLDSFALDLNKLSELSNNNKSDNLISIPLIHEHLRSNNNNYNQKSKSSNNKLISIGSSPSSTTSSFSEILEPIPRGLLPLPDLLLNIPYYYDSFLFYLNSTSSILTPADSTLYINNPFKVVLPKLAMTNDGLMSLIIAFGLAHKNSLLKNNIDEISNNDIIDSLLSRALSDLLVLLNNKETSTSDLTLTLVMLFTSFLAFNYKSDKWKIHMNGAKQIFLLRGYNKPFDKLNQDFKFNDNGCSLIDGEIKKSKLLYFLIRWFAYLDIFTVLSSPLEPTTEEILKFCRNPQTPLIDSLSPISDTISIPSPIDISNNVTENDTNNKIEGNNIDNDNSNSNNNSNNDDEGNQFDYEVLETEQDLIKEESHKDIDYMLGFNIKFLPLFSKLCKLIKFVNLIKRSCEFLNKPFNLSPKVIESAITIQSKFQKLKFNDFLDNSKPKFQSINAIIASNSCFLLMGMIQLYRRVLLMPRNSKIIQEMCLNILKSICKYIDTSQPNALGVILPLFIAGCECENLTKRPIFIEKLNDFQNKGSVSAKYGIEIMQKCWSTGQDWCDIMTTENRKVVFI